MQQVEADFLVKLRDIRANIDGSNSGVSATTSKEIDALRAENEALKKRNAKLEYRVQHMLHNMEELYGKASK